MGKEDQKMAVHIRLRRIGKNPKGKPHFRVTVFNDSGNSFMPGYSFSKVLLAKSMAGIKQSAP